LLEATGATLKTPGKSRSSVHTKNAILFRKFLRLIWLLDFAKRNKVMAGDPCLFKTNAPIKYCGQILWEFGEMCLTAEGDFVKHLRTIGYHLSIEQEQTPLDEIDWRVNRLATDLRDGVRLARLLELHSKAAHQERFCNVTPYDVPYVL
jgi:abnormal spindle-like microcephaly-associated protein